MVQYLAHKIEFAHGRPLNGYSGVFGSHEEARKAISSNRKIGYDYDEMGEIDQARVGTLNFQDYPVLFWLQTFYADIRTIFDIGGHCGELYYAYRKYIHFPKNFIWRIFDVPAVIASGKKLATTLSASALEFTTKPLDMEGADMVLASGSLQYLPEGFLPSVVGKLQKKPRHVIVHRTPLHGERSFVTIQATGPVFCPYTIAHRQTLIDQMTALGYTVVDSWTTKRVLEVPFHPECRLDTYSGIYFCLQ
jgi:putative methyltransferase (TIGR04325 family)